MLSALLVYSLPLSTSGKLKISSPENTILLIAIIKTLLTITALMENGEKSLPTGTTTQVSNL
tara:strand:+ start:232 stop:417 length:186 start_codon:yes stop_codon:yes gene_type:complete